MDKLINDSQKVVLIAEDDEISYFLIQKVLSTENIHLIRAKNGEEAVKLFKQTAYISLILMDLNMPIMGGIEALTEIRQVNTAIPIIVQTANIIASEKETAMEAGCTSFFEKPIDLKDLKYLIEKHLN